MKTAFLAITLFCFFSTITSQTVQSFTASVWERFQNKNPSNFSATPGNGAQIMVNDNKTFQTMTGFGAALSESSAIVLMGLPEAKRNDTLKKLFDPVEGIGISYLRVTTSASDFSTSEWTFDDVKGDVNLTSFSINKAKEKIIPCLKLIKNINPKIKLMASPWTAPAWMKSNNAFPGENGGTLKGEYYETYAKYWVKTIKAFEAEGVPFDTMTIQNEPLFATGGYPGMVMSKEAQSVFLNVHLARNFLQNNITTKVYVYDHNWDNDDYPWFVLERLTADAKKIVAGTGFHCYGGKNDKQNGIHARFPDFDILHTECSGGGWSGEHNQNLVNDMYDIFIGAINNWSSGTMKWNLALDHNNGPQWKGCKDCRGVVTINTDSSNIHFTVDYYVIGIFSKHVLPGAKRIEVTGTNNVLIQTGFITDDGWRIVYVHNTRDGEQNFNIVWNGKYLSSKISGKTIAVYKWKA